MNNKYAQKLREEAAKMKKVIKDLIKLYLREHEKILLKTFKDFFADLNVFGVVQVSCRQAK